MLRGLLDVWLYGFTTPGKYLAGGVIVSACAAAAVSLRIPLYTLFCVLFFLLVASVLCGFLLNPKVQVKGNFPDRVTAGQILKGRFSLKNTSRFMAYDMGLNFIRLPSTMEAVDPDKTISYLPGGSHGEIEVGLKIKRRGFHELPSMSLYTVFPFSVFRIRRAAIPANPILALPNYHPLIHLDVPKGYRYQPGGIALTSHIGESAEYIGNREYRPGDLTRRIDFRSWGRLGKPAVREYQEEYYCRVALILDTYIPPERHKPSDGFPEMEAAISLTASIADALAKGEFVVDLFAAGPDLYTFRSGRNIAHFDNILEILACVDECRKNPFETIAPAVANELSNITTVIFILLDWDLAREKLVRAAIDSGCSAKVVILRNGKTSRSHAEAEDWAGTIVQFEPEHVLKGGVEQI